jgi:hypothetical protein
LKRLKGKKGDDKRALIKQTWKVELFFMKNFKRKGIESIIVTFI